MQHTPFAPWEPDKAAFGGSHAVEAMNVAPDVSGYVPLPAIVADSGAAALPGAPCGAVAVYDVAGNPITLAGDKTALYQLKQGKWVRVGSGYGITATRWRFARYGEMFVAVNGVDVPQYAKINMGDVETFKPLPGAPVASCVQVVKEFVMLGEPHGTKIRWSAIGDPLGWPEPGSNDAQYKQSDEQSFPDTGNVVAIAGGLSGLDALVFTERAMYRGQYVGSPFFFQFDALDKSRGAIAPHGVVSGANIVYFLSEEGFLATNGASATNIGFGRVNNWFREKCDAVRRSEVRGAFDPSSGVVYWSFPSSAAKEGEHDYLLLYHSVLDRWSYGKQTTTDLFVNISCGVTLEDLNVWGALESVPYSLDSPVWKGGVASLGAFNAARRLCWASGKPLEAMIETAETGGQRMMIHGVRPLVDGELNNNALPKVEILHRDHQHAAAATRPCSGVSPYDGLAYARVSARYARARVRIPAGGTWRRALGCDFLIEQEGCR